MEIEQSAVAWQTFAHQELLTEHQLDQFKSYYKELVGWNEDVNLTRITDLDEAIAYHFQDSLSLGHAIPMDSITSVADIGSGAGFPSIPLKIKYPHLHVTIIEVSGKRISFLQHLVQLLGLSNVTFCHQDWRTFLRQHKVPIDYFCARASLQIPELLRMFKPSCSYQKSSLVYWASDQWDPLENEKPFINHTYAYTVGIKQRKLVFFNMPTE